MVPATLDGLAVLPAASFDPPPAGAPEALALSGRFLDQMARQDTAGATAQRTGLDTPFAGQPLQGISGFALARPDEGLWAIIDNGFGSRRNSPDALLSFVRLVPDFAAGTIAVAERVWLRDPDRVVPFRLVHELTDERFLTGGDLDLESIQIVGDSVWIGDEFGPFLISATLDGVVTGVFQTELAGQPLRAPDHPSVAPGSQPGPATWQVASSGGYEGMALAPDGTLWAMLEQPLWLEDGSREGFVRILQFDPAAGAWTGQERRLVLTEGATAIGDVNLLPDGRALVLERDGNQGTSPACPPGTPPAEARGCFPSPAVVKRLSLVDWSNPAPDGTVATLRQIDLLDIADPQGIGGAEDGRFAFPFVTIESVVADGEGHVLIANDNNLPFSSGRHPDLADDNELIRLAVPEFLAP
jgi:hypothetical protein